MAIRKINSRSIGDTGVATADIADGSISTAKLADSAVTYAKWGGTNLGRRNLVINGAMQVAQRGTSFSSLVSANYSLDRWKTLHSASVSGDIDYSQSTDAPEGFTYSLKLDVNTATASLGTSNYYIFQYGGFEQQDIDHFNWGTSNAKEVTLSFWVKSNKTGTLAAEFQYTATESSGASVELAQLYTINSANTWEYKTLTFPASTAFTSDETTGSNSGLSLYMWLAAGSNYTSGSIATDWGVNTNRVTGQSNYLDSTSNEIYFTGFQLEVGDTATPFEHRTYGEELKLCERYLQQWTSGGTSPYVATGRNHSSTVSIMSLNYRTEMRGRPSLTYSISGTLKVYDGYDRTLTSLTLNGNGTNTCGLNVNGLSSGVGNNYVAQLYFVQGGYIRLDAEL